MMLLNHSMLKRFCFPYLQLEKPLSLRIKEADILHFQARAASKDNMVFADFRKDMTEIQIRHFTPIIISLKGLPNENFSS